jgi:hypothetical protein
MVKYKNPVQQNRITIIKHARVAMQEWEDIMLVYYSNKHANQKTVRGHHDSVLQ